MRKLITSLFASSLTVALGLAMGVSPAAAATASPKTIRSAVPKKVLTTRLSVLAQRPVTKKQPSNKP